MAQDSTQVGALESLAWLRRILPWFLGGREAEMERIVGLLQQRAPYRAQLLRGYFARLDRRDALADSLYRALTSTFPDSVGAWFALGESALLAAIELRRAGS